MEGVGSVAVDGGNDVGVVDDDVDGYDDDGGDVVDIGDVGGDDGDDGGTMYDDEDGLDYITTCGNCGDK